ncbi:MAG TPA: DUF1592 domain-containing protein [Gammaproteobacteria bacterium]
MRLSLAAVVVGSVAVAGGGYFFLEHWRAASAAEQWTLVEDYCVDCHNEVEFTAGLALDRFGPDSVAHEPEIFEEVVRKLRGSMMPPPGRRRPDPERVDEFVAWLESTLDDAAAEHPNPGYVTAHRLNRYEYERAVEALLGVDIDATRYLPADDRSDGFDNIANVLKASPTYVDQYIAAARDVSLRAVGESAPKTTVATYPAPGDVNQGLRLPGMPPGTRGGMVVEHWFPADGEYEFDIRIAARRGVEDRHDVIMTIDGEKVFEQSLGGPEELKAVDQLQAVAQAEIRSRFENIRLPVKAGPRTVAITFVERAYGESEAWLHSFAPEVGAPGPSIGGLEIVGPYEPAGRGTTPSREKIFVCRPKQPSEELPCAEEIIYSLARRAYRGAVTEEDLGALLRFYEAGRSQGDFDAGIRQAVMAILASPKFLYRVAPAPEGLSPGDVYAIDDLELASRLSFFLWSQMPDDALLDLALEGRLSDPDVLEAQVRRMLADPRSKSLVTNFAFQWLKLYKLDEVDPNPTLFPEFDESLRRSFVREMELFVDSILREDRPVVELLTAKHTFVDERLALHYGIPNVRGSRFRRVEIEDPNRFGLFGKGAILMATSYGDRTSPVLRGAWFLENIVGTPPAAPPADVVTDLKVTDEGGAFATVRERLEQHRGLPSCNGCHGVIDPPGLALENFDAIGRWREVDVFAGAPIDSSGELADGTPVTGPVSLRNAIVADPEQFVQTLTEKLLTFALGRTVEYYDMPAVRKIVRDAARDDYRFSSLVMGVVTSDPFRLRRVPDDVPRPEGTTAENVSDTISRENGV